VAARALVRVTMTDGLDLLTSVDVAQRRDLEHPVSPCATLMGHESLNHSDDLLRQASRQRKDQRMRPQQPLARSHHPHTIDNEQVDDWTARKGSHDSCPYLYPYPHSLPYPYSPPDHLTPGSSLPSPSLLPHGHPVLRPERVAQAQYGEVQRCMWRQRQRQWVRKRQWQ